MDEQAFGELVEPHRRELRLHCYRILGSLTDAEDVLQETLLAAWRGLDGFEGRSPLRSWLYKIATNRCLNALRSGRRRPPEPVPPFEPPEPSRRGEVTWLQPIPDTEIVDDAPGPAARYEAREAVKLAFVAGLQRLPPRQAAVLVLRDVLGYPAGEVARMLDTTETAVKGALQRARAALPPPRAAAEPTLRERELSERFAEAFTSGDVDGVVELLTDDAWLAMPPAPHEYHGRAAIAAFLRASTAWRGARPMELLPTRANAQPAFGCYIDGRPAGMVVLTISGAGISAITRFLDVPLVRWSGQVNPRQTLDPPS